MKRFFQVWLVALVVKTGLSIWLPLSNDEAYYWVWGHHPQWSYFDHPPMVGWLFYLGTYLENIGNGARLPGVWLGHLTLLVWSKILEPFLDSEAQTWWLIFILLSPFFGVGSLVITPDIPLVFFWSLSILFLLQTIRNQKWTSYIFLGASLGLGFCSKYMIVLFVPIALLWLGWTGKWRQIQWRWVPLTLVAGLLFSLPVLYWNGTHDWESFRFQLAHGLSSDRWNPTWPGEFIGGQILLFFPTLIFLATRRKEPSEARFLHFFGWLPIGFFLYSSFKAHVEANWPIMAHPSLLALAFLNGPKSKSLRVTLGIWAIAHVLVFTEVIHHWLPIDPSQLKTAEFTRFDQLLPLAEQTDRKAYFGSYQMAAAISYKTRKQFYKVGGMNRRDFYDFLPQSFPESGQLIVGCEASMGLPDWLAKSGFSQGSVVQLGNEFKSVELNHAQTPHQ